MVPSTAVVSYGESERCQLAAARITRISPSHEVYPPLADPAAAVRHAFSDPIDFPPLAQATVPGDSAAIAIGPATPMPVAIAVGAIGGLLDAGVEPNRITVVSSSPLRDVPGMPEAIAEQNARGVRFHVHNPDDERQCALVGVTQSGYPLRINRAIAEADVVVPIGGATTPAWGGGARWNGLYPAFSERETILRFQLPPSQRRRSRLVKLTAEADEAGWLLGVLLSGHVVPAACGGVAAVFAGDPQVASRLARERYDEIWKQSRPDLGDLVVATLRGSGAEQSWDQLARALQLADQVASVNRAIAVCCELSDPPGKTLRRLQSAVDFVESERSAANDRSADAWAAFVLSVALQQGPVYLRSRLAPSVVESLGMTPIGSDEELARLAVGRTHCVVIEDAQLVEIQDG